MRARHESFGGILALDRPAATVYVDRAYMQELTPMFDTEQFRE